MSDKIPISCFNCRSYGLAGDCLTGWCKAREHRVAVHDACAKWMASERALEYFAGKAKAMGAE